MKRNLPALDALPFRVGGRSPGRESVSDYLTPYLSHAALYAAVQIFETESEP